MELIKHVAETSRELVPCLSPAALGLGWVTLQCRTVLPCEPANAGRRLMPLLLAKAWFPRIC